ncbi:hypothetical protein Poli38472_002488 [Pythium oligandrum]|uniref:RING-type domain-containing protein n=1 Tax=Pythium oligandrum TaxID=41045 RepID=A0A8K1CHL7_PYTOL|nr:hypothetical protein Poli38472_002488 [Pythium oligandrum]|eukprot:TMW63547.1 hypothetical protein Poli38472_002488 [Pythium oligandrum]
MGSAMTEAFSALWNTAEAHDVSIVQQLLSDATITLEIANAFHPVKHTTALMAACHKPDKSRNTSTHCASTVVSLLLEFGVNPNAHDVSNQGNTALHYAAMSNQVESVKVLLRMGADPFVLNNYGHAAIDLARWHESGEVHTLLTNRMRVKHGWLYVKKKTLHGMHAWDQRYCVVLACDASYSTLEFAVFTFELDHRPVGLMFVRAGEVGMVSLPMNTGLLSRKLFMFEFDQQVSVCHLYSQDRFSRQEMTTVGDCSLSYFFGTTGPAKRAEWMQVFERTQVTETSSVLPQPATPVDNAPDDIPEEELADPGAEKSNEDSVPITHSIDEDAEITVLSQQRECVICLDAPRNSICVPCGHLSACYACLHRQVVTKKICPICRTPAQTVVRVYEC